MRRRAPLPAWAIARNRAREAERNATDTRAATLLGLTDVVIVWSNDTMQGYHLRCRADVPPGRLGSFEMGISPFDEARCGACHHPLVERTDADTP